MQQFTDSGAAATDDVVCAFEDCAVLNPRGRFEISMHLSFLSLLGQVRVGDNVWEGCGGKCGGWSRRGESLIQAFHPAPNLLLHPPSPRVVCPQTQDFKIRYSSIQRLFILPKSNSPHTLVVVSLDPPIRKGQTYYTHVLCQFPSHDEVSIDLELTPEQLAAKNEKVWCGNVWGGLGKSREY